jgi:hypothetical protein
MSRKEKKRMRCLNFTLWVPILFLSLFQNTTGAPSPVEPIKAKQRKLTYQVQPDGSKILKWEEAGAFYRSSTGATMNTMGDRSTFLDEQGNTYNIVHSKKLAKLVVRQGRPELFYEMIKDLPPEGIQGYEMVNGLECAIRPVLLNGKPSGKAYTYLPYGLTVKIESTTPGGSHWVVRELYDIEVAEPDPALVRIPEGYSINDQTREK